MDTHNSCRRQHGVALISALVVVLIVAILGVSIGKQVIDSRRNSTVYYDHSNSFVRAESALFEARAIINDNHPSVSNKLNPDDASTIVEAEFINADWWKTDSNWNAAVALVDNSGNALDGNPEYLLEDAGLEPSLDLGRTLPRRRFIKVSTRANGDGTAESVVQAYVAVME
ncbi:pilus assembly PilX family protein [Ferrimonas lipolytica]|uniref:Type IV pilus assembly protein PilX n=1 Tax=Ferrimonas lipolytica TaxID=2724191 RepID=A0A6H1UFM4_9GAMM|nr:hypothetical protein [Ferrimonas lipolytica]QIZ77123.1 hypothetical protein HER31_09695 [Ferrimonas lipolytica]